MMKKVTFGLCLLASAAFAVAVADAQSGGGGGGAGGAGGTGGGAGGASSGASSTGGAGAGGATSSSNPSSIQTGSSGVPGTAGARGNFQSPRQGAGAQQPGLPAPQQNTIGAQNQFSQPGAPREQAGQRLQTRDRGIQTRQNIVAPGNRYGQQRGFNFQSGAADPQMTPAERQAQGFDAEMQTDAQRDQYGATGQSQPGQGQRGELGVWLASNGGQGVEIRSVTEGSAAAEIGLQAGDVLLEINGQPVGSPMEVQRLIRSIPAGQTAMLEVWRDGAQQEVSVTLQPMRESYRSGYRGSEMSGPSGNLESRTMRLEEQLSMVMRELQQIRADMSRRNSGSIDQASALDSEPAATPTDNGAFDDIESDASSSAFDQSTSQPETAAAATEPEPFATETPAAEPDAAESAATEPDETEPAASEPQATEPAADLFGSEPAETETETAPANETETETDSDAEADADLFQ